MPIRKTSLADRVRQLSATAIALTPQGTLLAFIDPEVRKARREIGNQANAFVRSAGNTVLFHAPDHLEAATNALLDRRNVPLRQRYDDQLARQRRLNQIAASKYPVATALGQAGGTAAGVALVAPEYAAARLAGAAGLTGREVAALLGAGAATNTVMQVATDVATGRAPTVQNAGGAAIGGTIGAGSLPFVGSARASAVAGWTTSAAQDLLNGRPVSLERAGQAAISGGLLGNVGAKAGTTATNKLPPQAKGRLGEQLGAARSRFNGEGETVVPKKRDYIGDTETYWYPDRKAGDVRYEDKFGHQADLTSNQKLARTALGENFVLNHFLPEDIGAVVGLPLGLTAGRVAGDAVALPANLAEIIAANRAERANNRQAVYD